MSIKFANEVSTRFRDVNERVDALRDFAFEAHKANEAMAAELAEMRRQIAELMARRGPGRPPKQEQ